MPRSKEYNHKYLKEKRRHLRNHGTSTEVILWKGLKAKQLKGRKFRRQFSIGNYILDFFCPSEKLCVELDGETSFAEVGRNLFLIKTVALSQGQKISMFKKSITNS